MQSNHQISVGIDALAFYTPYCYLDMVDLAAARDKNPEDIQRAIGQHQIAVTCPSEDIVTLGANAAEMILKMTDVSRIELLLFATESGIDQSKSAGIYVHSLLNLPNHCRVVELKQACYGATAALKMAVPYVAANPNKTVLIVAADIARYGLDTAGETSQGCGAVAMLISAQPRIVAVESESGFYTQDAMDFWRPNYSEVAFVDGKASSRLYLNLLEKTWVQYCEQSGRRYGDHCAFCYHVPVASLAERAHKYLLKISGQSNENETVDFLADALTYNRTIGNSYTASLYISLCSLLDYSREDLSNQRIGFYSYGSGAVAEYFSGIVQPSYQNYLHTSAHQTHLQNRIRISYDDYVNFYNHRLPTDGSVYKIPEHYQKAHFCLTGIANHQRLYQVKR